MTFETREAGKEIKAGDLVVIDGSGLAVPATVEQVNDPASLKMVVLTPGPIWRCGSCGHTGPADGWGWGESWNGEEAHVWRVCPKCESGHYESEEEE